MSLENLLSGLSSDPERVAFAKKQRELADASEARDTQALADHASSLSKPEEGSALDRTGVFWKK